MLRIKTSGLVAILEKRKQVDLNFIPVRQKSQRFLATEVDVYLISLVGIENIFLLAMHSKFIICSLRSVSKSFDYLKILDSSSIAK